MLSQPTGRLDSWPPSFVERSACSSAKRASKAFTSSGVISSKAGNQGKIEVLMGQYWKVMGKSMTGWWCNNHLEKDEWKMIETTNQMINGVYSWDNHHRTIFFGSKSRNFPTGAMFDWQVWEISWDPNELFEDWQLTVEYIWTNHFQEKEVEHSIRLCCQYRIWMIFQDIWGCLPTTLFFFFYQGSSSKTPSLSNGPSGYGTVSKWGLSPKNYHERMGTHYLYGSVSKPCTPVVHIKIADKWMFIPLKMVLIRIDPYPYIQCGPPQLWDGL